MVLFLTILVIIGYIILGKALIFLLGKILNEFNEPVMHSVYVALWPFVLIVMVVCVIAAPFILFVEWIESWFE